MTGCVMGSTTVGEYAATGVDTEVNLDLALGPVQRAGHDQDRPIGFAMQRRRQGRRRVDLTRGEPARDDRGTQGGPDLLAQAGPVGEGRQVDHCQPPCGAKVTVRVDA